MSRRLPFPRTVSVVSLNLSSFNYVQISVRPLFYFMYKTQFLVHKACGVQVQPIKVNAEDPSVGGLVSIRVQLVVFLP